MNANAFQYTNTNRNHNRYAKCLKKKLVEQNYVYQNIYESKLNGLTCNWVLGCYGDDGLIGMTLDGEWPCVYY